MALYEMYELTILEMRRNAHKYAEIGLEIGAPVFHRLMRRCTDPVNLGPRPHMKDSANAYKMDEGDARKLFDQVFRTQIPRVVHAYFCVPQYVTGTGCLIKFKNYLVASWQMKERNF